MLPLWSGSRSVTQGSGKLWHHDVGMFEDTAAVLEASRLWIAAAFAGDRAILRAAAAVIGQKHSERHTRKNAGMTPLTPLDRVAARERVAPDPTGAAERLGWPPLREVWDIVREGNPLML